MFLMLALSLMSMSAFAAVSGASIYMDEDFEGTDVFQELNWPVIDLETAAEDADDIANQGYEVRASSLASTGPMVGPAASTESSTETTTDRFFSGSQCLALTTATVLSSPYIPAEDAYINDDDEVVAATNDTIPVSLSEGTRLFQVAVSFNASSAGYPWPASGTKVGRVRLIQSVVINTLNTTVTKNIDVDFEVNGSSAIDVVSVHPNGGDDTVIGTLEGGADSWAMLSILTNNSVATDTSEAADTKQISGSLWLCYDPVTETYKGPQPINPLTVAENGFGELDTYTSVSSGVHIFMNANAAAVTYNPADIHAKWGNVNGADTTHLTDPTFNSTAELGWEISALSTAEMFIDDIYWDGNGHDDMRLTQGGFTREQASRMNAFDATSGETAPLAVKSPWYMLEK